MILSNIFEKKVVLITRGYRGLFSSLNCKLVSQQICMFTKKQVEKLNTRPKVTVILAEGNDGQANSASEIYVSKKINLMPQLNIQSELIRVKPSITKQEMENIIDKLNNDPSNTSTMVQLPFPPEYSFDINQIITKIHYNKNVDGFCLNDSSLPNSYNPTSLKPPTALGILTLLRFYGIKTEGKATVIIGKGPLVGLPLIQYLQSYPYYATVTACDIFTENIKEITKNADIVIAACGQAGVITADDIKQDAVLIDAGINQCTIQSKAQPNDALNSLSFTQKIGNKPQKRRIVGDICRSAYQMTSFYTPVPGGVGLLTVASLAFNVLKAYQIQNGLQTTNLQNQFLNRGVLRDYLLKQKVTQKIKIMLLSSAYNGLTQKINKTLINKGYQTFFQIASSQSAMRQGVQAFKPDLIICPTLMKPIPADIYSKHKCLIVHPGIKGDRGPSSIDWAILNKQRQWGVTLVQAGQEMDAGDIWATKNFQLSSGLSKVEIYNSKVSEVAEELVLEAISKFESGSFTPEKLNYENPATKGRLHRTIRLADAERTIVWQKQSIEQIMSKAKAADTQPGLKVKLLIGNEEITRFTYGYVRESGITPPNSAKNGQIFLKKYEAVCVKTKDGAVWIQQMRRPKSSNQPFPFKVPSTVHLGSLLHHIPDMNPSVFQPIHHNTFQEITFEKHGRIGQIGFDFYNGAMSTSQCERLASTIEKVGAMSDIDIVILTGSKRNWSNGLNLNVIQHSATSPEEAWNNIVAINKVVKNLYALNNKITISAVQSNAGAGGVYLALATDYCFIKKGVILNPHYKNMGLYGSELHTLTAHKFGLTVLNYLKDEAVPISVSEALSLKLIDSLPSQSNDFLEDVTKFGERLAENTKNIRMFIAKRNEKRKMLFKLGSLNEYEQNELQEMRKDIFENRNNFAQKRRAFVTKQ